MMILMVAFMSLLAIPGINNEESNKKSAANGINHKNIIKCFAQHDYATSLLCIRAGVMITTIAPKITPIRPKIFGM